MTRNHTHLIRYERLFKEAEEVSERIAQFEKDENIKFDSQSFLFRGAINQSFRQSAGYKLAQEWSEANRKVAPAVGVVEEFLALAEVAESSHLHLKTPIHKQSANLINLRPDDPDSDATQVFRIASDALGRIPICNSLRDTIELANEPETVALRHKIDQWLESLPHGEADRTLQIQQEIAHASETLIKSRSLQAAGYITGIIGVPLSLAGFINPFCGALGLTLDCIAIFCDRKAHHDREKVKWVGFGSR